MAMMHSQQPIKCDEQCCVPPSPLKHNRNVSGSFWGSTHMYWFISVHLENLICNNKFYMKTNKQTLMYWPPWTTHSCLVTQQLLTWHVAMNKDQLVAKWRIKSAILLQFATNAGEPESEAGQCVCDIQRAKIETGEKREGGRIMVHMATTCMVLMTIRSCTWPIRKEHRTACDQNLEIEEAFGVIRGANSCSISDCTGRVRIWGQVTSLATVQELFRHANYLQC